MPIDVITLKAVATELNQCLADGKIEKIYQPESDEISLLIKKAGCFRQLIISANPTHPRMHISTQKKENLLNAPAFCMLLRKYILGAVIEQIEIFNNDRIIRMTLKGKTELKESRTVFLIAELMGRYSNIILTSEDMVILDAIKRIHFDQSTTRYILPNLPYVFQPQNRITFEQQEQLAEYFSAHPEDGYEDILKNISGIGKETALEIAESANRFTKLNQLIHINQTDLYQPCLRCKNGKPVDYFIYPYQTIQTDWTVYSTLNEALDVYYSNYDREDRKKASSKTVTTILKRLVEKNERRIKDNLIKLKEWDGAEDIRRKGEFITCYLYLIKPGDKVLICSDYYKNEDISIPIDPTITPAQNAQRYYKRYAKLKRAMETAKEQLTDLYEKREYLQSIRVAIDNCTLKTEFDEILTELNGLGGYVQKNKQKDKVKPSEPNHVHIGECDVYFGRNNQQNAQVTFRIGSPNDIWMHAKAHHGTHLIIKGNPNEETILRCAELTAYYSDAKESSKVEVDFTLRKFVKKIPSALPGLVTYTDYKTILCEPKDLGK